MPISSIMHENLDYTFHIFSVNAVHNSIWISIQLALGALIALAIKSQLAVFNNHQTTCQFCKEFLPGLILISKEVIVGWCISCQIKCNLHQSSGRNAIEFAFLLSRLIIIISHRQSSKDTMDYLIQLQESISQVLQNQIHPTSTNFIPIPPCQILFIPLKWCSLITFPSIKNFYHFFFSK